MNTPNKKFKSMSIDNLLTKTDNKFMLSNAVAGRARQILSGSLPYVNDFDPTNPIVTALKEISRNKIGIKVLKGSALVKAQEQEKEDVAEAKKAKKDSFSRGTSILDALAKGSKQKLKKK
ncbi:MAG: DNA-directed RNA polymerase subunit omega [Candidatus Margulisbacteria bacterium]|nr:DNA-directed RNA polymerase subunit omega [Candidatus Margulisiibacteriota bacterium]MBU1021768.1 DNA-directed RNA polymerase subunit omega [Candidatus Margulisiibacteriota bacterium]MBU1729514.1 DNA-directed RNA polymerase subunit omega [Candidatus Margulisiibacteriota bacterium]MBU1955385.1 DNA-directed RNA polymerase subunit omega [Candidatus Margulisiibacteriota bacterium]